MRSGKTVWLIAAACVLWIGIPLPDSSEAQWARSQDRGDDGLYQCTDGDLFVPAYNGIGASTIYCNGMQRAWELAGWLGLSVADAATIITRLPLNPDGTRNTSCPLAGDCDPQVADLSWDTACLNTALAILVSQQTGTATSIDIGPQTCLTGTVAATATITESGGADWSIVTAAAAENLTHAGSVTGSGSLTVTACVMASCAVSTAFPWSYVAPPTPDVDTTPPNPVTKVEVTAGVEEATVSWDQVSDPANGTDWSGISEYRIYCDGMLCDTIASPSSGPIIDLTERAIGSPMGDHSCTQDGAELTVVGGGAGQDGTADSYSGCYTPFTGAFIAAFEIGSLEDTAMSTYHKAVFDARASLDANSAAFSAGAMHTSSEFGSNAFTHSRPRTSVGASRATAFNQSVGTANEAIKPWYRIERRANGNFDYEDSDNGTTFTKRLDNYAISLPSTLEIGLAATATSDGVDVEAVFDSFSISTGRLSKTVTGLTAGSTTFTVRAVDVDGNLSVALPGVAAVIDAEAPPSPGTAIKWHPGHYAAVYYGYNWATTNTVSQVKTFLDSIQNDDYVVGIQVVGQWSSFEGATAGDYSAGFARMDEILAHAALRGKRVMLRIMALQYGGYSPSNVYPNHFPAYLVPPANGGTDSAGTYGITNFNISANQSGITLRTWETATMNRLIALTQAYGDRYNDNPYFEAIQCTCESSAPMLQGTDGYTTPAYIAQLKRWYVAARQAWPNTNIRSQTNFFRNRDESVDVMAAMAQSAIGQSQPDTVPHSASYFDEVYVGEYGGIDYRGIIPYFAEVESPELCDGKDSKPGADAANNYTPQEFYDFVMTDGNEPLGDKPIRPTHFAWEVHTGWMCDAPTQTWNGAGGHREFIALGLPTNTACPSTYPSCDTD